MRKGKEEEIVSFPPPPPENSLEPGVGPFKGPGSDIAPGLELSSGEAGLVRVLVLCPALVITLLVSGLRVVLVVLVMSGGLEVALEGVRLVGALVLAVGEQPEQKWKMTIRIINIVNKSGLEREKRGGYILYFLEKETEHTYINIFYLSCS